MKVSAVLLVTFLGISFAAEVQHKRGSEEYNSSTPKPSTGTSGSQEGQAKYQQPGYIFQSKAQTYTPPQFNYVVPQTYKYIPQPSLAQISYVPQQQYQSQQQYQTQQQYQSQPQHQSQQPQQHVYQPAQQTIQYSTPQQSLNAGAIKTVPAPQKLAYSQEEPQVQTQHRPIQYSSAADVSSFKFQSPLVTYSNLGVLQQSIGKSAEQSSRQYSQPAQQTQQQVGQVYTQQQPQFIYKQKAEISSQLPQVTYNPQTQQVSNEKLQIYSQAPQTFQTQKQPQVVYQQVAPKHAASIPQQYVYTNAVPQQYTYAPVQYVQQEAHSAAPQPSYVIAPQYQHVPGYHQQVEQ